MSQELIEKADKQLKKNIQIFHWVNIDIGRPNSPLMIKFTLVDKDAGQQYLKDFLVTRDAAAKADKKFFINLKERALLACLKRKYPEPRKPLRQRIKAVFLP